MYASHAPGRMLSFSIRQALETLSPVPAARSVHGQLALEKLIAPDAGVMLQCFAFLYHAIFYTGFRLARIEQRRQRSESLRLAFGYNIFA